jgi:hypothetical protein
MKIHQKLKANNAKTLKGFALDGQVSRNKDLVFLSLPPSVNPLFQVAHHLEYHLIRKFRRRYG